MLYSTYLGGDGWDVASSLAITPDGTVYAAGHTNSRSFPTRTPTQGPLLPLFGQNGFVSALVPDGKDVVMSTYVGDGRALEAVAVALDPGGNPVLAGHNIGAGGGTYNVPTLASDILIFRLDYSGAGNIRPRLDAILNAASRTGTPLAPGQRVALQGAAFEAESQVCFNDACVSPIAVAGGEILAAPPAAIPDTGSVAVFVQSPDGSRSNSITMAAGAAQLALYSADNSGTGTVLALNEDGTLNSPSQPARRGKIVTIPANGLDSSAQVRIGTLGGIIDASVSAGAFPGIPGEVPLIHATVDPNLRSGIQNLILLGYTFPGHQPVTLSVDASQPASRSSAREFGK
jgi:hypothetical protein